jgi:hypothetical protein
MTANSPASVETIYKGGGGLREQQVKTSRKIEAIGNVGAIAIIV